MLVNLLSSLATRSGIFDNAHLCWYNIIMKKREGKIWERMVPLAMANRDGDIKFWQSQKPKVRFRATWNLVADLYRIRGKKINADTLRLQRTVENIKQTQN